ncbi:MAG: TIM barrel protein [candidate division KSB1 bacterium]|nr:TIM barrel protein [candidate division KSB1 bacterium]
MDRRQLLKRLLLAGPVAYLGLTNCQKAGNDSQNIKWAMGWILWREYDEQEMTLTDSFQDLKDLGTDGIELTLRKREFKQFNVTLARVKEMLDDYGLAVSGHYFSGPFYDKSSFSEIREELQQKINSLKFFNARHIIIGPPRFSKAGNRLETIKSMGPVLNDLGKIAQDQGVEIGIHPHLKTIIETPEDIHAIMDATDPRFVYMSPDTGHIHLGGGDVVEILTTYKQRLNYFHFKDAAGEYTYPDFKPNLRELGSGEIDFLAVMRLLREIKYKGWINVEQDATELAPRASAEKSMKFIDNMLKPIYT